LTPLTAVPPNVNGTLVATSDAADKFTVTVNVPPFSFTDCVAAAKETVGSASLCTMVTVSAVIAPSVAFVGVPKVTVSVALIGEYWPSSINVPVIVPLV
jgi:hypothetical protein